MHFVYIVECADRTFYTGYANDIQKRIETHNKGRGAKYTRCRLPVKLVYTEEFETKSEAMKREYFIKQLSREQKKNLIMSDILQGHELDLVSPKFQSMVQKAWDNGETVPRGVIYLSERSLTEQEITWSKQQLSEFLK